MSHRPLRGLGRRRVAAAVAGSSLLLGLVVGVPAATAAPTVAPAVKPSPSIQLEAGRYIVLLNQLPTAAYDGRVSGYAATKPGEGEKYDPDTAAAQRYTDLIESQQADVLASAGVPDAAVTDTFTTVTNGFTAELTAAQATALTKSESVLSVTPDEMRQLTTNVSPDFLGLTEEGGLWDQLGGVGTDGAGSGTLIGVVDTGIWPESRSFRAFDDDDRDRDETAADYGFTGICDPGADGSFADECNNKLLGGRYYVEGFGVENLADQEFVSPRDANSHGSHTASTAAGRHVDDVTVEGIEFGEVSGMAPGARIAAYKACWTGQPDFGSGCFLSDLTSAINDAVADGVDAINYSIGGGSESPYTDPTEIAFLNAAIANVFVAASAGNSGPGLSTFDHPSPWLTTVAASTHKILESTLELGNGETFIGASATDGIDMTSTVLAVESALPDVDPADAQQCFPDTLDPDVVTGKIVVCDRGLFARVAKSVNVRDAGGVGLILVNTVESSVNADLHVIPSIHLDVDARPAIYDYVGGNPDATSAILAGVNDGSDTQVPEVIAFSSRGPSVRAEGDILKPDIAAPGVDVLAAVSPVGNLLERDYDLLSGTSMSSPHIAGLSLLLQEQHPEWSPAEQKSAMMTTAYDHATTTSAFAQGAGFVDPTEFSEPGLVYPADIDDWAGFLLGQGVDINYPGARPIEASQLNLPSIAVGGLLSTETVRRTVRNVGDSVAFYSAEVTGLAGIDVQVRPAQLVVAPGSTASFDVTFSYAGAPFNEYTQGHLTWTSGDTDVRIPMVVSPTAVSAPDEVSGAGTDGSLSYDITAGYDGQLDLGVFGLNEGTVEEGTLEPGTVVLTPGGNASTDVYRFDVPEGTTLARFDLDALDNADDFDLFIVDPDFTVIVASSATPGADERVDWVNPPPGNYYVLVGALTTSDGQPGDYVLSNFAVGDGPEGNLTVDPESLQVEAGATYPITLTWSGLNEAPYLGWVDYEGTGEFTIVSIDAGPGDPGTPPPPPEEDPVVRHAGDDRYDTSVDIGQAGFPDADTAVIVSGEDTNLVDGLVAAPLAHQMTAPVLLTERDDLPDVVADDLQARGATAVTIIGGELAVESDVVTELEGMNITVERIAGDTRWDTAALVAAELGGADTVVASGVEGTLMDALSAGGPAANGGWAILLTERDEVPAATQAALADRDGVRVVVGGPMVVSDDIVAEIGATRAGGGDRYETAAETSTFFQDQGVPVGSIVLASGEDDHLVDALAGGALGQLTVLTRQDDLPDPTTTWITGRSQDINTVNILGGEIAVSEDVADEVRAILE